MLVKRAIAVQPVSRLRKFGFTKRPLHDSIAPAIRLRTWTDAWCRSTDCSDVQLSQSRGLRAAEPPTASHSPAGQCRTGSSVSRLCQDLLGVRPGIDRAREVVAGTAAASLLLGPLRAATDGATDQCGI